MSVPVDDSDSYNDLQIDFSRKNHTFNLDNVGYISKDNGTLRNNYFPCSCWSPVMKLISRIFLRR